MKSNTGFKTNLFPLVLFTATLFFAACNRNLTEATDTHFMVAAAETSLAEIKLGQLAQQKGSIKEVQALGKMMEAAHTKELSELNSLAMHKGITVPSAATNSVEDAFQTLNSKSGPDFDKEYCNRMVTGHKAAILAFEKASKEASDADIKLWVNLNLPALRTHLEHALACEKLTSKEVVASK